MLLKAQYLLFLNSFVRSEKISFITFLKQIVTSLKKTILYYEGMQNVDLRR